MAKRQSERLDKILSHMGIGSRSEIRKMARQGNITVNGIVVKDSGKHIVPQEDVVQVDGQVVNYVKHVYWMMNKPKGYISATEDRRQGTVIDLLDPRDARFSPFPIGRLDKDTTGLLLLSNDGELAHRLLSPRNHVDKVYEALIDGNVDSSDVEAMREGVTLEDGYVTMPAKLVILEAGLQSKVELTIQEGKFHQVKRMFMALGKKVLALKRIQMGSLRLDESLSPGAYRPLTEEEIAAIKKG